MSFEIALSGIDAVNKQLGSISNNIANSATPGFKSSRANFASTYAGTQPTGVEVNSVTQNIGRSDGVVTTGRALDAAIQGKGFFITRDPAGSVSYTRVGLFNTDKEGYLVDSSDRRVQGYAGTSAGALGVFGDIKVPTGSLLAKASDKLQYASNLSTDWDKLPAPKTPFNADDEKTYNAKDISTVFDSRGNTHTITQYFVRSGNDVEVHYVIKGVTNSSPYPTTTLQFDDNGQISPLPTVELNFQPTGASAMKVTLDYTGTTRLPGLMSKTVNNSNGYVAGTMTGIRLEKNGEVTALYNNNQKQAVATIALANFSNENGLIPISDTSWTDSPASGAALISAPGGTASQLLAGALEKSNVDMTAELVSLMSAQRNYQANTKVISTENQVMQALMQVT